MLKLETKSDKIVREAKEAGRVVLANLTHSRFLVGDPSAKEWRERHHKYRVHYEYEVGGKKYSYCRTFMSEPPETLTLYYPENKPQKAIAEGEYLPGTKYIAICSIPLVMAVILYHTVFKKVSLPNFTLESLVSLIAGVGIFSILFIVAVIVLISQNKKK